MGLLFYEWNVPPIVVRKEAVYRERRKTRTQGRLCKNGRTNKTEYREVVSLLRKGSSIRDVASGKGVSTVQRVKRLIKVQSPQ